MGKLDGSEEKETEVIDDAKKEADIAEKLSSLEKKVESSEVLAKILADPEVRRVLEAKQRGEKLKIVPDVAETPKLTIPESVDYDSLSNQQLVEHTVKNVSSSIESILAAKLAPLMATVKNLESYVGENESKTVAQQIETSRKKYTDFDVYLPEMRMLNQQNPELKIEELYFIAKRRKVGDTAFSVASERPTSSSAKTPEKPRRTTPLPHGKAGMDQLLNEALASLNLE